MFELRRQIAALGNARSRRNSEARRRRSVVEFLEPRSLLAAVPLGDVGQPATAVNGTLGGTETALYSFTLASSSTTSISLTGLTESVRRTLAVDSNENGIVDAGESIDAATSGSFVGALQAGPTYLVQLKPSGAQFLPGDSTDYRLTLSAVPIAGAQDAGATLGAARNVGVLSPTVQSVVDVAQNGDVDVFRFDLSATSTLTATFNGMSESIDIVLVQDANANGQVDSGETRDSRSFVRESLILNTALQTGGYYLVVTHTNDSDNTAYTLSLSATPVAGAQDAGNTLGTALEAETLSNSAKSFVDVIQNGDVDVYRYHLASTSTVSATLTGLTEKVNVAVVQDLNANGQVDAGETVDSISFATDTVTLTDALQTGDYYLLVTPTNTSDNTAYTLSLSAQVIDDAQDAGDTLETALDAGPLTELPQTFVDVYQGGDVDVYRFEFSVDSTLTATISGLIQNTGILLIDDANANGQVDGGEVIESRTFATDVVTLSEALSAGVYYLRVAPMNTSDNSAFTLFMRSDIPYPEIEIATGATGLVDGTSTVDFGATSQGLASVVKTFTVKNVGTGPLVLQPLVVEGSGFSLVGDNFAPGQVLAAGGSATFQIALATATVGSANGSVSLASDDYDEPLFNFQTTGEVLPAGALPPQLGDLGGAISFTENAGVVFISPAGTVADVDSPDLIDGKLTVAIASHADLNDRLRIKSGEAISITSSTISVSGNVVGKFSGGVGNTPLVIRFTTPAATPAAVEALLRAITFGTIGDRPSAETRTISLVLTDGDGGTSDTETKSASVVPTNDAPVLDNAPNPVLVPAVEDTKFPTGTSIFTLLNGSVSDPDAGAQRGIAVRGASAAHGTWYFQLQGGNWQPMGAPSDSAALLLPSNAKVRFVPQTDFNGTVKLYYRAWDQTEGQIGGTFNLLGHTGGKTAFSAASESASLTVTPVNDNPMLSFGGAISYVHDKPAIVLAPFARVSDVDSPDFASGRLRIRITDGASTSNRLAIGSGFTVDASNNVFQGTTIIGKRVGSGWGTSELVITFNANVTPAVAQQLVRAITFKTVGGAAGQRKAVFTLSDGDGGVSAEATKTVNVG